MFDCSVHKLFCYIDFKSSLLGVGLRIRLGYSRTLCGGGWYSSVTMQALWVLQVSFNSFKLITCYQIYYTVSVLEILIKDDWQCGQSTFFDKPWSYIVQGRFSIEAGRPFILGAPMDQKCSFYIKLNGFMTRSRLPYSSIVVGLAEGNALTTIGASGFIDHAPHMQAMLA